MLKFKRSRTPSKYIYYALRLYFSGLSLRKASEHLLPFIKRNHVSIWNWIQRYKPTKKWQKRTKVSQFIIDETLIKVGGEVVWLWIAIEPKSKSILDMRISVERSILVAEQFLQELIKKYGKYPVSTDGGSWYPQACRFLKLHHHIHSYYEKSIIERTIQYIKDRTEIFDDYFPCQKCNCTLEHVKNWFNLFVDLHNGMTIFAK
ncbi:MAG TPA: DDE-type integrase/transposase/recombinase [Nitrososphaeraceae archaeon]|nr:DDE-type integrase/transposase/recombinase [Nitrososphaeraceae archaeon]